MCKPGWYRRFWLLSVIPFLIIGILISAVPVSAAEDSIWDSLGCRIRVARLVSSSWQSSNYLGSSFTNTSSAESVYRFGVISGNDVDSLARIPVSNDLSDIVIYSKILIESGTVTAKYYKFHLLAVDCYDSSGNIIKTVTRWVRTDSYVEYLAISGVEFPVGTSSFTVTSSYGSFSSTSLSGTGMTGVFGVGVITCSLNIITGDGSFSTNNWGTDNPFPFLFSHENQNIYLEKDGRIDFFVAARGFNSLSMHVVARTYADTTKFDFVYVDNLNYVLLSAVPPDTDEAAILCFDFYIQGNFVYTAPACVIYFSGWEGSETPGDSGDGTLDGDLLSYLEELKISQDEAEKQIAELQTTVDKLLSEIEGTEDQKEQADSFGQKTEEQLGQIKEDMEAMDQMTLPALDDIDLNIDTQVSGEGMTALAMLLGVMMNSQTVSTSMTFCFLFSLVAFVIFGKR